MKKSSNLRKLTPFEDRIIDACLPLMFLPLVRKGVVDASHFHDAHALYCRLVKNGRLAARKMMWLVCFEDPFLKKSLDLWRQGDREVSIVLFASAVEQHVNQLYQLILSSLGWKKPHVTALLRAISTEGKLTWMLESFTKCKLPPRLVNRLNLVFAIRNSLVHFKGEFGHIDGEDNSAFKVKQSIKALRRMSLSKAFESLRRSFWKALIKVDPSVELAAKAADVVREYRKTRS